VRWYGRSVALLSLLLVLIGFALLLKGTLQGKPLGLVLGALFIAVGAGRIYLLRKR
jgi:hypothetical protein